MLISVLKVLNTNIFFYRYCYEGSLQYSTGLYLYSIRSYKRLEHQSIILKFSIGPEHVLGYFEGGALPYYEIKYSPE